MSHAVPTKPAVRWALAAGAVVAGALWFGDKAPYPYAQHKLLDLPLPYLTANQVTERGF
ncbi:hypothetical protein [Actinopolymorpha rutila]|uniref:Uncharacterized protein n=1 Tax=Actinopolymorpha rutila TaxID=446787 RepID=A0A852Z4E0_9ACTN|nr:hypothetical protein [Actinopolymorpha rutila]NYH88247.1 hypothetical protein [Actinopolymorpha rutila]